MNWWGWIVIGTLLLGAELFAIDMQFYLVFIGIGAIITGLVAWMVPSLPSWLPWLIFAVLSITSMYTIRRRLYEKIRGRGGELADSAAGGHVAITEETAPGHSTRTEYRGTGWTAVNVGEDTIPAGATAVIVSIDGLNLKVRLLK